VKVVFHYGAGPALARHLGKLPGLDITVVAEDDDAGFAVAMLEAEVLWHALRPVTAATIAAAPKLRLIQKIGVGVNTIDLVAAASRDIAVCNLPGSNARAVAEMALMLMLAALRRLPMFDRDLRAGKWACAPEIQDHLGELGGRTVGLVGYGDVPKVLAPILAAMGCRVLYTARSPKPDAVGEYRDLNALLAESDVVSLHVPLMPETAGLIGVDALARMKPGAVLVNTARGGLVDQPALTAALRDGRLGAAGLDVFASEPADAADPIFALDNVVVAPHVAWITDGTFERSFATAAENCRRLGAGEALLNQIRP
jgi:phosphoglycerate dehydrogenase-like enzyme